MLTTLSRLSGVLEEGASSKVIGAAAHLLPGASIELVTCVRRLVKALFSYYKYRLSAPVCCCELKKSLFLKFRHAFLDHGMRSWFLEFRHAFLHHGMRRVLCMTH
jgi:hypothetical protein